MPCIFLNAKVSQHFDLSYAPSAPAIGRFTGVDPIADQFAWVSPFNYAENSPIAHIDLHGLQKISAIFSGMITRTTGKSVFSVPIEGRITYDIGNNGSLNFAINYGDISVAGSKNKGTNFNLSSGDRSNQLSNDVASKLSATGIKIPDIAAVWKIEGLIQKNMKLPLDENGNIDSEALLDQVEGQKRQIANFALRSLQSLISDDKVNASLGYDGEINIAQNSEGQNYKRQFTTEAMLTPEGGNINVNLPTGTDSEINFSGQMKLIYTEQECLQNCDN